MGGWALLIKECRVCRENEGIIWTNPEPEQVLGLIRFEPGLLIRYRVYAHWFRRFSLLSVRSDSGLMSSYIKPKPGPGRLGPPWCRSEIRWCQSVWRDLVQRLYIHKAQEFRFPVHLQKSSYKYMHNKPLLSICSSNQNKYTFLLQLDLLFSISIM